MSLWQFLAVVNGYADANAPEDKSLNDAEVQELSALIDEA